MQRIANAVVAVVIFAVLNLSRDGVTSAAQYPLSQILDDPTPGEYRGFGYSVAVDGGRALTGAPGVCRTCTIPGEPRYEQARLWDTTTGELLQTFEGSEGRTGDFGAAVAINGNHILIGAPRNGPYGHWVGRAFLFDSETGSLLHTFDDPTPSEGANLGYAFDYFGSSLAMDGNYVLIGAPRDQTNGDFVGQAHLFDITTGDLLRTFDDPTPTTADHFGQSVALNGSRVLIGASNDHTNGQYVGQAHLFDATTGNLLHTFDDPTVTSRDHFGNSVSMDGDLILVGAPADSTHGTDVGQVHLFNAVTGTLLKTFDDPTPHEGDNFGGTVTIEGSHVLIGRWVDKLFGYVPGQRWTPYLFDVTTGRLLHDFADLPESGIGQWSVAMDQNSVLIGAPYDKVDDTRVGRAYLYTIVPEPPSITLVAFALVSTGMCASRRLTRRC